VKDCENRSISSKDMDKSIVSPFLTHGVYSMRSLILSQVQRSEDGRDMRKFKSFNHSTCNIVLNVLKAIYLRLQKIVVEAVTVVKFEWTIEATMILAVLESR